MILAFTLLLLLSETFAQKLLGLNYAGVKRSKQIFGALENILVEFRGIVARHALVPDIDDYQDVFDAHTLQ